MELRTLEYKMRDRNGLKLEKDVMLWGLRRNHPIAIQTLPESVREEGHVYEFATYEEMYNFVLPDGRRIKKMVDRLTEKDFEDYLD